MKRLLILAAFVALGQALSLFDVTGDEWNMFKVSHRKQYQNEAEERYRRKIYIENKKNIIKHNNRYERGLVTFKMKLNHLSDMFAHEVAATYNGFNRSLSATNRPRPLGSTFIAPENVKIPDSFDWREKGAVTTVKDQGQCGSCWAFSSTGALEGQNYRKTKRLVSLSEQNLIDCSKEYGNNGCEGGLMDNAFEYIKDNRGIDTEKSYPYEAKDDNCKYRARSKGAVDTGFVDIPEGDEEALKMAIATVAPVAVAIDASRNSFHSYDEGVYFDSGCNATALDHGVLVVGYGTSDDGDDYWIVKNSWGEMWGDKGYILMSRNKNNNCGIASSASYPLV